MILRTEYDDIDPRRVIVDDLIDQGVLVPVKRCKHKRIDGHTMRKAANPGWENEWCPGAGIGEDSTP